ncbi:MAG: hypothetical protein J6C96_12555 [Oscillospiraceae bacterium]|nr:hypothetical protein [Oscillospiraceae bacterium]
MYEEIFERLSPCSCGCTPQIAIDNKRNSVAVVCEHCRYEARAESAEMAAELWEHAIAVPELRYNPYHDPTTGRFTGPGGAGGGYLFVGKGQKGKGSYVVDSNKFAKKSAEIELSESIKNDMLNQGLNSNIKGIRKKAEEGTGNYAFKNAKAVTAETAEQMVYNSRVHEKNGNTLIEGYLDDGTHAFYANSSSSPEIKRLIDTRERMLKANQDTTLRQRDLTGKTTTTYDRWRKNNLRKFDNYWYGIDSRAFDDDEEESG